jgi:hypothetical protein
VIEELPALKVLALKMQTLIERTKGTDAISRVRPMIESHAQALRERLCSIEESMSDQLYPFDHARADTTLKEFLLPHIPGEKKATGILDAAEQFQSRLLTVQLRLFARLARVAEKIEDVVGMPPLPDPQRDLDN